jgi:hypothetical protein
MDQTLDARDFNRRQFLKTTALGAPVVGVAMGAAQRVSIVSDPGDTVGASAPAQWATQELQDSLAAAGVAVRRCTGMAEAAS